MTAQLDELYLQYEGAIYRTMHEAIDELAHKIRVAAARDGTVLTLGEAQVQAGELMFRYLLELGFNCASRQVT